MGGVVDKAFGATLERNRDHLNARFAHARRTNRGLEPEPFMEYLRVCVEPTVVAAVRSGQSEVSVDRTTLAMYEIGLELVAAELAGPGGRYPVVSRLWRELLPQVVRLLETRPRDTIAALTNAVVNLSLEPSVVEQDWLDAMLDQAPHADTPATLLQLGQLLAWRGGMAHYRESVLGSLAQMPADVVTSVLGEVDPHDRWGQASGTGLRVICTVGDFRGLGGAFESPPEVMQSGGLLYAFDNDACYSVHADRFGAVLKRYARTLPAEREATTRFQVADNHISCPSVAGRFAVPAAASSIALGDDMALVALEHSHRILVIAQAA